MARLCLEQAVSLIIETYDIKIPITDIDAVVRKMGGEVVEVTDYAQADKVTKCEGEKSFTISILGGQPKKRRNMAIAQNIGTLFLHMGYMSDWEIWDKSDERTQTNSFELDLEKDEFACDLLMPRAEFCDYIGANSTEGKIDTYKVAEHFGVPNGVTVCRGKWMGVLRWLVKNVL